MRKPKLVVLGGGTGTFMVLSGLKKYPIELSAVVSMADDGGSTGMLRDELGVLPPGDVRQCLVALSRSDKLMRELMNYRFTNGTLKGHSVGNLLLSALEKITGSFDVAVEKASEILQLEGRVIPATLDKVELMARLDRGRTIRGERAVYEANLKGLRRLELIPRSRANPKALRALRDADFIVIGPGDLYSSLIPVLLVPGIPRAITESKAKKVYICNLMTKAGQTEGFGVYDYVRVIEQYLKGHFDYAVFNKERPSEDLLKRYARKGEHFVDILKGDKKNTPGKNLKKSTTYVGGNLLSRKIFIPPKGDPLARTLIRHNSDRLARLLFRKLIVHTL